MKFHWRDDSQPQLNTCALKEHLYFECLEFEMHFPMRQGKKRSKMVGSPRPINKSYAGL